MAVKLTIPFDSKSAKEELGFRERKIKETIAVKIKGIVAERLTVRILPSQPTLKYCGVELPIQGSGFNRFIQF